MTTEEKPSFMLKTKSVDIPDIDIDDIDELLAKLSAAELEELNGDFDPDNSWLPAGQRQRDQTDKVATGGFNRKKLLKFLEKKAKEEKDWEQNKDYEKKTRGKVYQVKEEKKEKKKEDENGEVDVETEWDDILTAATEEELVDLAAVLGFHSMLTQTQYYDSLQDKPIVEGFKAAAKAEEWKLVPDLPPNMTDVDETLEKLKNDDKELKHLNMNNIKNISVERLIEIAESLKTNTVLEHLEMANVDAPDAVARKLAEALEENKTLKTLNIESNYIAGMNVAGLIQAINVNQKLMELRVANQKPIVMGNKTEMKILKLIGDNTSLLKFGIDFDSAHCRIRTIEKLKDNMDVALRKARGKDKSGEKKEKS